MTTVDTKHIEYLTQLDLSDVEAKLYLMLLKSGAMSVRDLAEASGMKRTTAYFYIDQLVEKGLISRMVQENKKVISASDPETLESLVESKLKKAESVKSAFPNMLKEISETIAQDPGHEQAEIRYFKGKAGVKKIYEEALRANELRSYANLSDMENLFPDNVFSFDKALEGNPKLTVYELVEQSDAARKQVEVLSQNKQYSFKFLPTEININASDILIYDGNVAIINVRKGVTGVIFHNVDYYNISKELYNFFWNMLPSIEKTK